jgi:hypothetical protein
MMQYDDDYDDGGMVFTAAPNKNLNKKPVGESSDEEDDKLDAAEKFIQK